MNQLKNSQYKSDCWPLCCFECGMSMACYYFYFYYYYWPCLLRVNLDWNLHACNLWQIESVNGTIKATTVRCDLDLLVEVYWRDSTCQIIFILSHEHTLTHKVCLCGANSSRMRVYNELNNSEQQTSFCNSVCVESLSIGFGHINCRPLGPSAKPHSTHKYTHRHRYTLTKQITYTHRVG